MINNAAQYSGNGANMSSYHDGHTILSFRFYVPERFDFERSYYFIWSILSPDRDVKSEQQQPRNYILFQMVRNLKQAELDFHPTCQKNLWNKISIWYLS